MYHPSYDPAIAMYETDSSSKSSKIRSLEEASTHTKVMVKSFLEAVNVTHAINNAVIICMLSVILRILTHVKTIFSCEYFCTQYGIAAAHNSGVFKI